MSDMFKQYYAALLPAYGDGEDKLGDKNFTVMAKPNRDSIDTIPYTPFRMVFTSNEEERKQWVNPVLEVTYRQLNNRRSDNSNTALITFYQNLLAKRKRDPPINGRDPLPFTENLTPIKIKEIIRLAVDAENMYNEEKSVGRPNPVGRKDNFTKILKTIREWDGRSVPYWNEHSPILEGNRFYSAGRGRGTHRHHRGKKAKQTHRKKLSKRRR